MNSLRHFNPAPAVLALAAVVALAAPADANRELWYEATLSGDYMGHAHESVVVEDNGTITTKPVSDMTMRRGEELVTIKGTDVWVESADGVSISY